MMHLSPLACARVPRVTNDMVVDLSYKAHAARVRQQGDYRKLPNNQITYGNFNGLTGYQDAVKNHDAVGLNQTATFFKQAFRVDNVTYYGY